MNLSLLCCLYGCFREPEAHVEQCKLSQIPNFGIPHWKVGNEESNNHNGSLYIGIAIMGKYAVLKQMHNVVFFGS